MEVQNLSFSYDGVNSVLDHLNLKIQKGKITVLMGANGCGKSTLFNLMTKNLYPDDGIITLAGTDIDEMGAKEFAQSVAIVHQNNTAPPDLTVEKLVAYGRTPYLKMFQSVGSQNDEDAIDWALNVTNTQKIRKKPVAELSGGQRQRVWIAMALAMETDILFLDEPTTYLDIRYQIEILKLIRKLNQTYDMTIVMVLHDINQAMEYGDVFVGMSGGKIVVEGDPKEAVDSEILYELYGIRLPVAQLDGKKFVVTI
ncbi:MAG: ABC transporter ATP-binding protein [Lachnospiraceae bacterium]|nr:ABC transporter ATP-binding protein [Lachnospiraceae bacterium]